MEHSAQVWKSPAAPGDAFPPRNCPIPRETCPVRYSGVKSIPSLTPTPSPGSPPPLCFTFCWNFLEFREFYLKNAAGGRIEDQTRGRIVRLYILRYRYSGFTHQHKLFFFSGGFILYFCGLFLFLSTLGALLQRASCGHLSGPKGIFLVSPTEGIAPFSIFFVVLFQNNLFSPNRYLGEGSETSAGREGRAAAEPAPKPKGFFALFTPPAHPTDPTGSPWLWVCVLEVLGKDGPVQNQGGDGFGMDLG